MQHVDKWRSCIVLHKIGNVNNWRWSRDVGIVEDRRHWECKICDREKIERGMKGIHPWPFHGDAQHYNTII